MPPKAVTSMEASNWKTQLPEAARRRVVNNIMDMLNKHVLSSERQEVSNVERLALRFEEKIFIDATSQEDYLRKISLKLLSLGTATQHTLANSSPSCTAYTVENSADQASHSPLPQFRDQGQSLSNPLDGQNCTASSVVQISANSTSTVTPVTTSTQICMRNVVNKNLPNVVSISQNSAGNVVGQGLSSDDSTNSQMQVQGRQQPLQVVPQTDQQHVQNAPSHRSVMQASSVIRPFVMQSAPSCGLTHSQESSIQLPMQSGLWQHPQTVPMQQEKPQQIPVIRQRGTRQLQQPILPLQKQQQQLLSATNIQDHLNGQQNTVPNMKYQQQMLGQRNHSSGNLHHLGQQSISRLIKQSSNSSMHNDQQNLRLQTQAEVAVQHKTQLVESDLLPTQGQEPHSQPPKQQLMYQIQAQPEKLQLQPNHLPQDIQQRLQTSGSLLQPQHLFEKKKQSSECQSAFQVVSSNCTSQIRGSKSDDWMEEVYQKIKTMKDTFLPELQEIYKKIAIKLQQLDSVSHHPKTADYEKLQALGRRAFAFLHLPRSEMSQEVERKLGDYEKLINYLVQLNRPKRPISSLQQGQFPPRDVQSLQQPLQPRSQNPKVQSNGNQINPHMQPMNLHHSVTTMGKNNTTTLKEGLTISSEVTTLRNNMMNSQQPGTNVDSQQGNVVNLLQSPANTSQNYTSLSQSGGNVPLQKINHLQLNSHRHQNLCLKKQNEQKRIKDPQAKQQFQQCQMTKQLMSQKELIEPQYPQQPSKLLAHQSSQLHQMNELNSGKVGQGMGVKAGKFMQQHTPGQLSGNDPQLVKSEPPSPISLCQLLQVASPQILEHCSPQIDQKILQTSFAKSGTHLQSLNSTNVSLSPSTSLASFSIEGDPDELDSGVSLHTNSRNVGLQQTSPNMSLVISTPGLSSTPVLTDNDDLDGNLYNGSATAYCDSTVTEEPIQRLVKVVRSISYKALRASASDMESVVSMIERTAGSIPGNGSRSAVGENLVPVTNLYLLGEKMDGNPRTMKMRRYARAMPSVASAVSITDPETCDVESTATSHNKRPRVKVNYALFKEIREINKRLIDTVVDISDEGVNSTAAVYITKGGVGTIVRCSFTAVAINPNMKSEHATALVSFLLPLRLLVPTNYPNCSPVILDKLPAEVSVKFEDLSVIAKSKLSVILRNLVQPVSLGEIARTWDVCARAVVCEYAQENGGGNFSSTYGTWENHLSAA